MVLRNPVLLELLQCPLCTADLVELPEGDLRCDAGHRFPVVSGVPVFTSVGLNVEIRPNDHVSNAPLEDAILLMEGGRGPWIHLGAGSSAARLKNCIEVETAIFQHTDVVASGTALPFRTASMQGCLAVNVFEHIRQPDVVVSELARTIRPGGWVDISTAFLQPLHADPGHYFNVTDLGLREWFSAFEIESVEIPPVYHPAFALGWQVSDLLFWSPPHLRDRLGKLTLDEVADFWREPESRTGLAFETFMLFPESKKRILAGGFRLLARSPGPSVSSVDIDI